MSTITLTVEVTASADQASESAAFSFRSAGVENPDAIPLYLLAGVYSLVRQTVRDEMEQANPAGNAQFMDETAELEARLALMDMVVHLPERDQIGIITTI